MHSLDEFPRFQTMLAAGGAVHPGKWRDQPRGFVGQVEAEEGIEV